MKLRNKKNKENFKKRRQMEIIDAHEHLPPEEIRLRKHVDVFTAILELRDGSYIGHDLLKSGMPYEYLDKLLDPEIEIEKRWEMLQPYWDNVKHGSYARGAFITVRELYGFDEINAKNCRAISEQIAVENKPGIYKKILRQKCNIRVALTESVRCFPGIKLSDYDFDLLVPLVHLNIYANIRSKKAIEDNAAEMDMEVATLDDYLQVVRKGVEGWKSSGVVGLKMWSGLYADQDKRQAANIFDKLMRGEELDIVPEVNPLGSFLTEEMLDMAGQLGLTVAVHTGMGFASKSQHMVPIIGRHPETRFDLFHLGIPDHEETVLMCKNFHNAWLNLCWCHIISPEITCSVMDQMIDLVPMNKVIAFGADYCVALEMIYGHLIMAQENIARVLARRVERELLSQNDAIDIAHRWLYNNPKELYQLEID